MKRILTRLYEWIKRANQVLLFFFIIGMALLILPETYHRMQRYESPHVPIAQTPEEAKASVVQDVRFLGQSDGVYVFGLMKRIIAMENSWRQSASLGNEEVAGPDQMVNVVFSRAEQPVKKLLQNDGLIISHDVFAEYEKEKIKASLFTCVTDDTDRNHRLDENDRHDLYVIFQNPEKPDLVIKGISGERLISRTHLAVKTRENNDIHFWDIDLETQVKKEIAWK